MHRTHKGSIGDDIETKPRLNTCTHFSYGKQISQGPLDKANLTNGESLLRFGCLIVKIALKRGYSAYDLQILLHGNGCLLVVFMSLL